MRNIFWVLVILISLAISFVLLIPFMKIHMGMSLSFTDPFVTVGYGDWKYFRWTIPADNEVGFMLFLTLLCFVPGRLIALAVGKLFPQK